MAVDLRRLQVINLTSHSCRIVLIVSLTHTAYLCYDRTQSPSVKSEFDQLFFPLHFVGWYAGPL